MGRNELIYELQPNRKAITFFKKVEYDTKVENTSGNDLSSILVQFPILLLLSPFLPFLLFVFILPSNPKVLLYFVFLFPAPKNKGGVSKDALDILDSIFLAPTILTQQVQQFFSMFSTHL